MGGGRGVRFEVSSSRKRRVAGGCGRMYFGTAESREVGYVTPLPCTNCGRCVSVSCLLGCVPVREEEDGLGRGERTWLVACCAQQGSTIRLRVTADKSTWRSCALDASCLGGAEAAESDRGNTTVRAPPATASSADPQTQRSQKRSELV